jgi:hypothetical protein
MNKHLVLAAAFAALCSHAAFAAGEGGESDTWSELEPRPYTDSTAATGSLSDLQRDYTSVASMRYDGGDTWSELEPKPYTGSAQALTMAATDSLSGPQRDYTSVASMRYDGGDTWSELEPKPYKGSAQALTVAR